MPVRDEAIVLRGPHRTRVPSADGAPSLNRVDDRGGISRVELDERGGSAEPGDSFRPFVARRRRPRRLDREHRLVDRRPETLRKAGARHHAVAVARCGDRVRMRVAERWQLDPPRSHGSWRRTRRSPRRDLATAPTVRRQRPRGRSHRRRHRRAPSARCVRHRRASTRQRRPRCRASVQRAIATALIGS